ncbi:MAG: hypothetical protein KDG52_03905 [Rhodocyclaceae bacterium]|nr:hypothetical protein [Rhodocyclaceae bacterium]
MSDRAVALLAFPDAVVSTLTGIYDVLGSFRMLRGFHPSIPDDPPFQVEIVGERRRPLMLASGIPVHCHRAVHEIARTDIVLAPSVLLEGGRLAPGTVSATRRLAGPHARPGQRTVLGLLRRVPARRERPFDGREATAHWGYEAAFRRAFPSVGLWPEKVLVVSGAHHELVTSGASMTWHDLVLYLVARHVGSAAAQAWPASSPCSGTTTVSRPTWCSKAAAITAMRSFSNCRRGWPTTAPSRGRSRRWRTTRGWPSGA